MIDEKREQVAAQCKAVSHMAAALAQIYGDYEQMFAAGGMTNLIEPVGKRTAYLMETLGNILNGMDAATEEDDWMTPVFEEAERLWPQRQQRNFT